VILLVAMEVYERLLDMGVRRLGLTAGKICSIGEIYIKTSPTPHSLHLSHPLHLQPLKSQYHGKSSGECPPPLISPARGNHSGGYHAFIPLLYLGPLASPPGGFGFLSGSVLSSLSTLALTFQPSTVHFATHLA